MPKPASKHTRKPTEKNARGSSRARKPRASRKPLTLEAMEELNQRVMKSPEEAAKVAEELKDRMPEVGRFILDHVERRGGAKKVFAELSDAELAEVVRGFLNGFPEKMRSQPFFQKFGQPLFEDIIRRLEGAPL